MSQIRSLPRSTREEFLAAGKGHIYFTISGPLFEFETNEDGKKEKIQNFTREERLRRRRYMRSRQMAPKRFGQRIQLQIEAWADVAVKRATEDAKKAEKEQREMTEDIVMPQWMQLLAGEEIEYVR